MTKSQQKILDCLQSFPRRKWAKHELADATGMNDHAAGSRACELKRVLEYPVQSEYVKGKGYKVYWLAAPSEPEQKELL